MRWSSRWSSGLQSTIVPWHRRPGPVFASAATPNQPFSPPRTSVRLFAGHLLLLKIPRMSLISVLLALVLFSSVAGAQVASCKLRTIGEPCLGPLGITGGIDNTLTSVSIFPNQAATITLSISGSNSPFRWSIVGGSLPPGFLTPVAGTQGEELILSGTPTSIGVNTVTYTFTVQVLDAIGDSYTGNLSIIVFGSLPPLTGCNMRITAIEPGSAPAGGPSFTLTMYGNFDVLDEAQCYSPGATYYLTWSGNPAVTCGSDSTLPCSASVQFAGDGNSLTALIPAEYISTPGVHYVDFRNSNYFDFGGLYFTAYSTAPSAPVIASLSPASAIVNTAFTLTVYGTNFTPGAAILWNGTSLPTSFISSSQLTASVSATETVLTEQASITVSEAGQFAAPAYFGVNPVGSPSGGSGPAITSVSSIAPQPNQTITLTGSGFGSQTPYNGDSHYIEIADLTGNWTAGFINNGSPNQVTLNVTSWTDSQIVIQGLTGAYGQNNWVLNPGDKVEVEVWNPQSGAGPATLTVTIAASGGSGPAITSVSSIAPQPNQTITLTGSGFGSQTPYNGDSHYIEIADLTGNWTAGWINNGSPNQVTLNVTSWTDSQIVIQGLTGAYGHNWVLNPGDKVEVEVWNPQSGAGPATLTVTIAASGGSGPAITSVSPSSAPAGSPSVTVTITGSGFAGNSVAQWNGLSLGTTFVNSTTLTALITAADLTTQGTGQITVANSTGPVSNSFPFVIASPSSSQFLTVAPCRIMDTRPPTAGGTFPANSTFGSPYISASTTRMIPIPSSSCGVPANAMAYSLNFTAVPRTGKLGSLTVWPTGLAKPNVSTLTSPDGSVLASAAIVPAGTAGSIDAYATDDTDLVVDINGYFVPPAAGTLQFYPLPPCRVLDTRPPTAGGTFPTNSTFGSPSLNGGSGRSFPITSSACGAPASAAAYSLNVTVVPQGALGYVTAWPTGQTQPFVSTMNSYDGTVLANAGVVPAGRGGAVSFSASNTTDLVVDINGYFAPPGSGGLNFYTVTPCRLVDTRNANSTFGGPTPAADSTRNFLLPQASCGLPAPPAVEAYSLSMTVYPQGGPLSYLTTWPQGGTQPFVSTLNAYKGLAVANAALVPAGKGGAISVFVTNNTDLTIDTAGYFGP